MALSAADQVVWDAGIGFLKTVDPIATSNLKAKFDSLANDTDKASIVAYMKAMDSKWATHVYVTEWSTAARGWLMYKLATDHVGPGYFDAPTQQQLDAMALPLQGATTESIKTMLLNAMNGKDVLNAIMTGMNSNSRNQWDLGAFTNPKAHSATRFRYLIHAMIVDFGFAPTSVGDKEKIGEKIAYQQQKGRGAYVTDGRFKVAELYFQKPDFLRSEVLCCSIIEPGKTSTYRNSPFGYVMSVPKQNIVAAWPRDASSAPNTSIARGVDLSVIKDSGDRGAKIADFLEGIAAYYSRPLDTPDQILGATTHGHNEIAVLGSTPGAVRASYIAPSGIFLKTAGGFLAQEFLTLDANGALGRIMKDAALAQGIPIVNIPDASATASNTDFTTWVNS